MGLDAYINRVNKEAIPDDQVVDFNIDHDCWVTNEVMYWRKFSDLQGWMQKEYMSLGGTDPEFNCSSLLVTSDMLERLRLDIKSNSIGKTTGFFFGEMTEEKWKVLDKNIDTLIFMIENTPQHKFYYSAWY